MQSPAKPVFDFDALHQSIAILEEQGLDAYHAFVDGFADDDAEPDDESDEDYCYADTAHAEQRAVYMSNVL